MRKFNITAIFIFLCVVGGVLVHQYYWHPKKTFQVVNPQIRNIEQKMYISGNVYPIREIEIKSQVSGVVDHVYVEVGDVIQLDQPIATIKIIANSSDREKIRSNMEISRVTYANAYEEYRRDSILYAQHVISLSELEASECKYFQAKEQYNTARYQYDIIAANTSQKNIKSNIVTSSSKGVIIDIPVEEGSSVIERNNYNPGTTVAIVAQMDKFVFKTKMAESVLQYIKIGSPIKLFLYAYDSLVVEGLVTKIASKGELINGVMKYTVEAHFFSNDNLPIIRSGYSATAELILKKRMDVLSVEEKYIQFKDNKSYVYLQDSASNSIVEQEITIGCSNGEYCEIQAGLVEEDKVVAQ